MLLYKQNIVAPSAVNEEDLKELYVQRANRKFLGLLPYHYLVWLYYKGLRKYDQQKFMAKRDELEAKFDKKIAKVPESNVKKINNLQFRKQKRVNNVINKIDNGNTVMQWGEPLAVFDTAAINLTVTRMKDHLFSKGYFHNMVAYEIDTGLYYKIGPVRIPLVPFSKRDNGVSVKYLVEPGKAHFIDTIVYAIPDTAIFKLLMAHQNQSFIKQRQRYDQDNLTNERERIDLLLKDEGYYDFSRQYVEFDVDTSYHEDKFAVRVSIREPAKRGYHKKFIIDEVKFTTDAGINLTGVERKQRSYRDIDYYFYDDNYNLRILSQRVFILPGDLFSRTQTFNTQRQLANLDAFKFVNVNYDTVGGKFIANIFTSSMDRYQWSNEVGVNVTQGYPGPFYNISFKKRNVFKSLESLDLTGRAGFEGVASATESDVYKSTEAGVNLSMTFPQLLFPFRERTQITLGKYNPKTRVQAGYAYTDRPEYRRTNASFSGTYYMENKRTTQYSWTFTNINLIDTLETSAAFRDFLSEQNRAGNFSLVNAFSPSFVTSTIFGITWNHNNYGTADKNATFIRATFESGGTIWNFIKPDSIMKEQGLQYFKYYRGSLDIRRNRVINRNTVLAYRFNSGVAYGYGVNKSVPYEKFFFAGGSNSIRAWSPRRLGPGSFRPEQNENKRDEGWFNYRIEKPAEILLETSIELRKKLFGFVHGAVFIDAGNVWTFKPWVKRDSETNNEVENGNSQFRINQFYKEIGVGTGFGIRFDFSFLILRFDVGIKVFDPARDSDGRFVLDEVRFFKPYATKVTDGQGNITYTNVKEPAIYNIGIGFPF